MSALARETHEELERTLVRVAGRVTLGCCHNPYGNRNVVRMVREEAAGRLAARENNPMTPDYRPFLRATVERADRVLAMLEPLCPPV